MVGALGVVVNNARDRWTLIRTTAWMAAGMLSGSLLTGTFLIGVGAFAPAPVTRVALPGLAFVFLIWALAQVMFGIRPLQSRWQVPEGWRRQMPADILALLYGFLLGVGVLTAVVTMGFWALVALTPSVPPQVAFAGWVAYPLARTVGFMAANLKRRHTEIYVSRKGVRVTNTLAAIAGAAVLLRFL